MSSRSVSLTSTFLMLAAGGASACSNDRYHDEGFYCADENGVIVDEDYCDDHNGIYHGGGPYYIYHSPSYRSGYRVGSKLPSGGSRFPYNDSGSRSTYGLPSTGRVGNGTVKSGVVGKGGGGSHSSGHGSSGS
ncbi:hypothetical protein ACWT_7386 [Actinoplanes sp. SE50]|uniref:hypothetical protein n=1 Tax=unclassified Actinoplanes TaxID=2626549 RepID=UPI00023EE02A|nr:MULTISPECIES: hypothetical protein [unclassified Actinoplanes]AEV88396.1 hypothetical protein ACPL_7516 [Actinoplanes sp. SE50/110]ATO86801.1 hypothetical protein ACWT_7386 [Actinoplanes sp. SE50]SLM04219.1 hypothetical protein ACSP50_7522 [Actinoplanes sp. SE50/110]